MSVTTPECSPPPVLPSRPPHPSLSEDLVLRTLCHRPHHDLLLRLKFFDWSSRQPGHRHTRVTYHAIFRLLSRAHLTNVIIDYPRQFSSTSHRDLSTTQYSFIGTSSQPARQPRFNKTLIVGYVVADRPELALQLFAKMRFQGLDLNHFADHVLLIQLHLLRQPSRHPRAGHGRAGEGDKRDIQRQLNTQRYNQAIVDPRLRPQHCHTARLLARRCYRFGELQLPALGGLPSNSSRTRAVRAHHCPLHRRHHLLYWRRFDDRLAMGNPTVATITHVLHNKQEFPFVQGVEDLLVLSLSCGGVNTEPSDLHKLRRSNSREWAQPVTRIASDGAADLVDHAVAFAFGQSCGSNYVRFQDNGCGGAEADCDPSTANVKALLGAADEMLKQTNNNWNWFLVQLKSAMTISRMLIFISNGLDGLEEHVPGVFEHSHHEYCMGCIIEDYKSQFEELFTEDVKEALIDSLRRAVYACTIDEFNESIDCIKLVSEELVDWVSLSKPQRWSDVFVKNMRHGHYSSNVVEIFKKWLPRKRYELSIVQMIDMVRCKMTEMIFTCRESANSWSEILTPSTSRHLQVKIEKAHGIEVACSTENMFECADICPQMRRGRGRPKSKPANPLAMMSKIRGDASCPIYTLSLLPICLSPPRPLPQVKPQAEEDAIPSFPCLAATPTEILLRKLLRQDALC